VVIKEFNCIVTDRVMKIIFFFIIFFSNVCAMEQAIVPWISRRESKFDSLKLHELQSWHEGLSNEQKEAIQANLEKQDQTNVALFKVATQLPLDIQRLVVAHMFDGYNYTRCCKDDPNTPLGEYTNAVHKFYEIKISTVFDYHNKATNFLEVLKKSKKDLKNMRRRAENLHVAYDSKYQELYPLINDSRAQQHVVFELLEDLLIFSVKCKNRSICCKKSELQSIERVCNTFPDMMTVDWIDFRCRDPFTIDNFKKQFHIKQLSALPFFLAPFITIFIWKLLPQHIDQNIVVQNEVREFINSSLQNRYEETGNSIWLSEIRAIEDPLVGSIANQIIKICALIPAAPILCLILGATTVCGYEYCFEVPIFSYLLYDHPFVGMSCVTGLYALTVAFYNFIKMRSWRENHIAGKNLSELLRRTDIVIE
jgi:hypothetical protein